MTLKIHPTAIIAKGAQIADNVEIGPYCVIGDDVKIGQGTVLKSHIVIEGDVVIGQNNKIFPFTTIGMAPQDLKFKGEKSKIIIGDNNTIREHVTIHLGTQDGTILTKIGNNCLFMVATHIAHDCEVGNNVILANNATLAGHVIVQDHVVIGGLSAIHQFVRIGKGAMIGGMSGVEHDVIPNGLVMGERAKLAGLNLVGMKRRNISRDDIHAIRNFFKELVANKDDEFATKIDKLATKFKGQAMEEVLNFVKKASSRAFCQPKDH